MNQWLLIQHLCDRVRRSPRTGCSCSCSDVPPAPPRAWPAGTRASASVSGHGCWEPSDCCRERGGEDVKTKTQRLRVFTENITNAPGVTCWSRCFFPPPPSPPHHIWIIHLTTPTPLGKRFQGSPDLTVVICARMSGLTFLKCFFFSPPFHLFLSTFPLFLAITAPLRSPKRNTLIAENATQPNDVRLYSECWRMSAFYST